MQPTVTSFLHLFRMLCIYYPVNFHVKNGNVDEDYMSLLTSYHDCMLSKFKENVKEAADLRHGFQEILQEGFQYLEKFPFGQPTANSEFSEEYDTANDHIVYDLSGYILYARSKMIKCHDCWKTLETTKDKLPGDFLASGFLDVKDRGRLKWATPNLYYTISAVELILDEHFKTAKGYLKDSFEDVVTKLSKLKLPLICCDQHRSELVPKLIFEYVVIRFRFKARNRKNVLLAKVTAQRHSNMKQSKLISTKASKESIATQYLPERMTTNLMTTVTDANNNLNASTSQQTNVCVQPAVNKAPEKKARRCGKCRQEGI